MVECFKGIYAKLSSLGCPCVANQISCWHHSRSLAYAKIGQQFIFGIDILSLKAREIESKN